MSRLLEKATVSADQVTVTSDDSVLTAGDLFDHAQRPAPSVPPRILTPPVRLVVARKTVRPAKIWLAAFSGVALALLFRFPFLALVAAPLAAVGVALLAGRWPRSGSVVTTLAASAFLAQATSIFVTPFTWPLRFGFFAILIGALVFFLPSPAREL
jgi:hypothetical protein